MTVKQITNWIGTPASLIIHTVFFVGIFALRFFGVKVDEIMLILTTVVSLEAIYLSIFIQMAVNNQGKEIKAEMQSQSIALQEVRTNMEEVMETVEEVQDHVEDLVEVEELKADVTQG